MGTPPLAVARALRRTTRENKHIGLFDITAAFVHSSKLMVLIPPAGVVPAELGPLMRGALCGTRCSVNRTDTKSSVQGLLTTRTSLRRWHAAETNFIVEVPLEGMDRGHAEKPLRERRAEITAPQSHQRAGLFGS